jgi:hypothetical protein
VILPDERRHLLEGPWLEERPGGSGLVRVVAGCPGDASAVNARAREVMISVLDGTVSPWPSVDAWRSILPDWFVAACAPDRSAEETEEWLTRWRSLTPTEQGRATREQKWALSDWLFWLEPSERQWFWWNSGTTNANTVYVVVEVAGWPAPLGALDWLLRASGAIDIRNDHET